MLLDFGKKIGETLLDIFTKVYCLTKKKLRISVVSFKFSINLFKTNKNLFSRKKGEMQGIFLLSRNYLKIIFLIFALVIGCIRLTDTIG